LELEDASFVCFDSFESRILAQKSRAQAQVLLANPTFMTRAHERLALPSVHP